jgi:hypothetical protein
LKVRFTQAQSRRLEKQMSRPKIMLQDDWCPMELRDYQKLAWERGGSYFGSRVPRHTTIRTRRWKCALGHSVARSYQEIDQGIWCLRCKYQRSQELWMLHHFGSKFLRVVKAPPELEQSDAVRRRSERLNPFLPPTDDASDCDDDDDDIVVDDMGDEDSQIEQAEEAEQGDCDDHDDGNDSSSDRTSDIGSGIGDDIEIDNNNDDGDDANNLNDDCEIDGGNADNKSSNSQQSEPETEDQCDNGGHCNDGNFNHDDGDASDF